MAWVVGHSQREPLVVVAAALVVGAFGLAVVVVVARMVVVAAAWPLLGREGSGAAPSRPLAVVVPVRVDLVLAVAALRASQALLVAPPLHPQTSLRCLPSCSAPCKPPSSRPPFGRSLGARLGSSHEAGALSCPFGFS